MSKVSIFKSVKDPSNPHNRDVEYALRRIKEGKSKEIVEQIRKLPNDKRNGLKMQLPGVCFQGTFKHRSVDKLIQHSGFIIIDIDKIDSPIKEEKEKISKDEYIYALWISPSGKGLKGLVKIPPEKENHKGYFDSFGKHLGHPKWDSSGSDVSRICFESYDPEIYINENALIWSEIEEPEIEDVGVDSDSVVMPIKSENRIIDNLLTWWKKKYGSTKGDRNNNIFKIASAFNDFGININEAERVLFNFVQKDFTKKEIETTIKSAYKKTANFGTKFFEDKETIEKVEKLVRSGKKKTEITKSIPESKEYLDNIKENLDVDEYWTFDDKNRIRLSPHKYKFWLEQNNFFKFYPSQNSSTFTFIKRDRNLLEETNEKRIKDYVLEDLMSRPNIGYTPYDFMASNIGFFRQEYLSQINSIDVEILKDTKHKAYLYFKNCVAEITKNGIKEIDYIDIPGHVWKKQIVDRDFKQADHHDSVFRTFIWRVSGENRERYNTLKSVIGYMLHSFKNSANNRSIILNDVTISENPNGGAGKGIFWNAIDKLKNVSRIDGKSFEFNKSFPYQTVSTDTQVLVFDDVKKNFNFENLFSLITEGITLEYKGQDAISVPVSESPKILITTNYTIGGTGGSFERRKFEVEFSDHYHDGYSPLDEFGHMFFDEWSDKEWSRFDNYMIQCIQYYLKNGLVQSDYQNLETRKFIRETSHEFWQWTNDGEIPVNERIYKNQKFNDFIEEYPDYKRKPWFGQKKFASWLDLYGKFMGFEVSKKRDQIGRYVEFSSDDETENNTDNEIPF